MSYIVGRQSKQVGLRLDIVGGTDVSIHKWQSHPKKGNHISQTSSNSIFHTDPIAMMILAFITGNHIQSILILH